MDIMRHSSLNQCDCLSGSLTLSPTEPIVVLGFKLKMQPCFALAASVGTSLISDGWMVCQSVQRTLCNQPQRREE